MSKPSSVERHKAQCSVCCHPQLKEIERLYTNFISPDKIAEQIPGISRDAIYRHADMVGLSDKKGRNLTRYIDKMLEKGMEGIEDGKIPITSPALVSLIQARAKINSLGQWVDKIETADIFALMDRMTEEEAEAYAQSGTLPAWAGVTTKQGATVDDSEEAEG